jgi:hypothetical protein
MSRELGRWPGMHKGLSVLVGVVIIHLGIAGCSKDNITTPSPPSSSSGVPAILVGTWKLQTVTVAGMPVPLATVFSWRAGTTSARIIVGVDSSLVYEEQNAQDAVVLADTARFSINGDRFIATTGALPSDSGNWSVAGSELDLSGIVQGYNYNLKATKID